MYRRVLQLTLIGYLVTLLYAGWMPLRFQADWPAAKAELGLAWEGWSIRPGDLLRPSDTFTNVALFAPVGFLLAAGKGGRWARRSILLGSLAISAGLSVLVELGQLFEPSRYAHLRDVLADSLGGLLGALIGTALFATAVRAVWRRLLHRLKGRYGLLAATALAAAMMADSIWRIQFSGTLIRRQFAHVIWSPLDGLAMWPWHQWVVSWMAAFAALGLLVVGARPDDPGGRRRVSAMALAVVVAAILQAMHLVIAGHPPNMAAVVLAVLAAGGAGALAPNLRLRRIELPVVVLACAVLPVALAAHVEWLAGEKGTRLPLWSLYRHEALWAYRAAVRRWVAMAATSFLLAFYLSLTRPWRLRDRMLVSAGLAAMCAAGFEFAKWLFGAGGVDLAGFGENVVAAGAGALMFAGLWQVLDRRDRDHPAPSYVGVERRRPPD